MVLKKINKEYRKSISSPLNLLPQKLNFGIVYTLYSDRFNSIKVGYTENDKTLQNKGFLCDFILLDKKKGRKEDLDLLIKTLKEFDINFSRKLSFKYSNTLIRHLSTLGWPVGRSLYKQRKIEKKLSFAQI